MKKKILALLLITAAAALILTGCMPGDGRNTAENPGGFFWGIWHGWIAPVSLIFGFFRRNIRIYEIHNSGWLYDLGFYLAVAGGFGSLSFFRKKRKQDK